MSLSVEIYFLFLVCVCLVTATYNFGPQPRIISQDGHLIFYAAEHKNITLQTHGIGGVHVNGIDLSQAAKISQSALDAMRKYKTNFESSFEKISKFEQLMEGDDGLIKKINTLSESTNASGIPVNAQSVAQSVRKINRRVNSLQRQIRSLTSLLTIDECVSNPCKNGGTCQDFFNSFVCHCPPEWEGTLCDKDVNECARFAGTDLGCQNGATCINKPGSYECLCLHGWFGLHCTRRSTDCNSGSNTELCGHGTCVTQYHNVGGSGYKCICDQGWTTDGQNPACNTDVDECAMDRPACSVHPLVKCINIPGSFQCASCPAGFTGNGFYCADIDECVENNGGCSVNPKVQCLNTHGSRTCGNCPPGYIGDGILCSYQGACANNGGCHHLATCRSNPRISDTYIECICPSGYTGNGIGSNGCVRTSEPTTGPCVPNPCVHGTCSANGTDFVCDCARRYTGRHCDTFKNMCESNPCQNGGTCTSYLGMIFRCRCTSAYTGSRCENEKQACGGRLSTETGVLTFPSGSYQTYENSMSCAWVIKTNATKVLNITFNQFSLEDSTSCQHDWLQIHDGGNTLARSFGRFCGHDLPNGGVIISTHNTVYMWFRSDRSRTSDGFELSWSTIDPYCGSELQSVQTHGAIESPGSPGNYPNNRDCYWPLMAPFGKRLLFSFFTLMIGNDSNCDHDYLEFITGTESTDPVFAKYCNNSHPSPLYSIGPEVLVHFHSDNTTTYPGFRFTYAVVEGMPGCGGVYTAHQGEIRSPSYDGNYPNNIICEYKIQPGKQSRIKLTFISFFVEDGTNCDFDSVTIHAGATSDAPVIGKYCGNALPPSYVSENSEILIVFKTDWESTGEGFVLKYETVCGGVYKEPTGTLESPGYPEEYGESLQCTYQIAQPLGYSINLKILDLDVESWSATDTNCEYDFLQVRDGPDENSTLFGTYCLKAPPLIVSTYNYLWLKFESDISQGGRGFQANYTTTKTSCGGIIKDTKGTISSPNYPEVYPEDEVCKWTLYAPPGNVIQIVWTDFRLEGSDCDYDYVEVFENNTETETSKSIGKYCGSVNPPRILSTTNMVTIVFESDFDDSYGGFLATYTFMSEQNVCGGDYYTDNGILKSLNYPNSYPDGIKCTWTIQAPNGHQILLNVTDFELEEFPNCIYDRLEIRNGGHKLSPLLGKYCGTEIPKLIPSHSNKLYIYFETDEYTTGRGFKIHWEATATGCGGVLSSPFGSITSPNYPEEYADATECIWKISVSAGSVIQIIFSDLDLEYYDNCTMDYVEILDGPTLNSKSLGKYCSPHPSPIRSTSNTITVKFISDLSQSSRGFQIQYSTICNNTVKGLGGVIESPNFPNMYPDLLNCNWEIEVADNNKINISFSHINIEKTYYISDDNDTTCKRDYIEILFVKGGDEDYDDYYLEESTGSFEKYGTYCGTQIPSLITLDSNNAKIHFVTDSSVGEFGFRLEWQIEGCGEVLTHPSGTIMTPNYPKAYPPSVLCQWKIQVDYGSHIEIRFSKIKLEIGSDCIYDYVKLFNGEDDTYPEIATLCHREEPTTLRSSGNFMFIKFKTDVSGESYGFQANYTSLPTKCGGKFTAPKATIMSPNYPKNYGKNDSCSYLIEVGEGYLIQLKFDDFDLYASTDDCSSNNHSYVKVYDGPSIKYPLLAKICGKDAPTEPLNSTTNTLFVEFVINTDIVAKGFSASYSEACGARIETEGTGIITSSIGSEVFLESCAWTIVSKDLTKHVYLKITHLSTLYTYCNDDDKEKPLTIFNGESPDAPLLGGYCGSKIPPPLTSDGSALHITKQSEIIFSATYSVYESTCGDTLTSTEGYFASPGYPKKYPMEYECEWIIHVEQGNYVSLSFIFFELLESEHCNSDYLEIRQMNGTGKLLGTFCGDNSPSNITNVGSIWLYFKTSRIEGDVSAITAKGFYAEYILNHDNELTGSSGTIVSPLYSQPYPISGQFSWTITVNYGKRILLTLREIHLDGGYNDYCISSIDIYDGSDSTAPSLGEFCGSTPPDPVKTTSNVAYIRFSGYTSWRILAKFIIDWLQVDAEVTNKGPKSKGCGSEDPIDLNSLKNYTIISSPGYPNGYDNELNCQWIITTIPMNHLTLSFSDMSLQRSFGSICYADYVEIFQKTFDTDWQSVRKVCHDNATSGIQSFSTNLLKVVFKTDRFINGTGFSAKIMEDCGGTLTESSGYIVYDNTTKNNYRKDFLKTCQWNITVRAGKTINIQILNLDIHHDENRGCNYFLMVRNGKFSDSPTLGEGKYCGIRSSLNLTTTGNNAYVKFYGIASSSDFVLYYHEVSYECNEEVRLTTFANSTEISSPNYPNIPPSHIQCSWRIIAPPLEVLRIDFIGRFDLLNSKGCQKEYVEIRDGGTEHSRLIKRFCTTPNSQFSTDNMLYVKFFTDIIDPSNGFKARISLAKCGGTIRGNTGQLQSPFFSLHDKYPVNANCTWHLLAPKGHNMRIKFRKIDLEEASSCSSVDHVTIYEEIGENNEVNSFGDYCGKTVPSEIQTSENEAIVHFQTSKETKQLGGFSLEFNSRPEVCGGTVEATEGIIKSPGYPIQSREFRRCSWLIKVPRGRRVTLEVKDIDMGTRSERQMYGILIFQNEDYRGFIRRITLSTPDKVVRSSQNFMFIVYWKAPNSYGRGFKATFSSDEPTVCEGDFNQISGTITQSKEIMPSYFCTYIRDRSSAKTTVAMSITTTTNATKKDCVYHNGLVQIDSGDDKLIARVCIPSINTIVRSPFSLTTITAVQYGSTSYINYTISYNTYQCGGVLNTEIGSIASPGYPTKYSSSLECSWQLNLPKEQTILLTFDDLNLGSDCVKSYVDIYNGDLPTRPKIGRYCQNQKPSPIRSQTNALWIDYKYDQVSDAKGFSLKYEPMIEGCGGVFHDFTRIIETPSYPKSYPNNAECLWELRSAEGYNIGLVFTSRFQIEESDDCQKDFVEIWDWRNNDWFSLGKKCGREVPKTVNSTSNRMKILFRSNDKINGQGFRAQWKWNCGGTFAADNTERFIVSPGFPQGYEKNIVCQYKITARSDQFINIKFYHFDLEGTGTNCKYDNFSISNTWNRYRPPLTEQTYCGTTTPSDLRIMGSVNAKFMTDRFLERTGFRFSYQIDSCGGTIDSPKVIASPTGNTLRRFPFQYEMTACVWNITAPPKKVVVIQFQRFQLSLRPHCFADNVEIFDGTERNSVNRIASLCGNLDKDPPVIRSKNNSVIMTLRMDRSQNNAGFKAEIYFVDGPEAGCGGRLNINRTTTINAPNLADLDCLWNINSPMSTNIRIHIAELTLPSTCGLTNHTLSNCSCSFLEVRDGSSPTADIMVKLCGITSTNFATELTSSRNSIAVRVYTKGLVTNAFTVTVTPIPSICSPVILNATNDIQILTSPGYPNSYPSSIRCTWLLRGSNNFILHFVDFDLNEGDTQQHADTNVCGSDKLEIVDESGLFYNFDYRPIDADYGTNVILNGNRRMTADFLPYMTIPGNHQFCGKSTIPFDYYSQNRYLTIKFSSGSIADKRGKGFKLEYHLIGCNRNFTSLHGRIVNSVKTDGCYQLITVPENYTISLFFQSFVFPNFGTENSESCEHKGLEIRDGGDRSSTLIQKSCGYALPNPVFSTKNKLWIHGWNSLSQSTANYDIVYTSSDQGRGCGGALYNYRGKFTSPMHPLGYKSSTLCVWDVRVPIGMRVAIKFTVFDIEGKCDENYLKVTTFIKEEANDHKYCRNDNPAVLYSNSRLQVAYQSSVNNNGTGWMAMFEAVSE